MASDIQNACGISELSEVLHAKPTTVGNWYAHRHDNHFPEPVRRLSMGPLWDSREVARWWVGYKTKRNIPKVGYLDPELMQELGLNPEDENRGATNGQAQD